jgi:hypothetical protein
MALLPPLLLLAVVVTVSWGLVRARRTPPSREAAVAAGRVHARRTAAAAVGLGAAAAVYVGTAELGNSAPGGLGVTALLVPIAFGVVHTTVLGLGELTWPRPDGGIRRARLVRRGLLDAAPRRLVLTAVVAGAVSVATLGGGAMLADPTGRGFAGASGPVHSRATPFPGPFYGLPAASGLVLLALLAVAVLWIVANRPAVDTGDERIETALRTASAHRVLRAAAGVALVVDGGLLFVGGNAVRSVADGTAQALLGMAGAAVAVLGIVSLLAGLVLCCLPAPSVPADAPAVPAS